MTTRASELRLEATRRSDDAYNTPAALARAICLAVHAALNTCRRPATPIRRILEPSAGSGSFVQAALDIWPTAVVDAVEVRLEAAPGLRALLDLRPRSGPTFPGRTSVPRGVVYTGAWQGYPAPFVQAADLIIGNPPYTQAEEHVLYALQYMKPGAWLAFLLRLSFLCTQERVARVYKWPLRALQPIVERPSFTEDGGSDLSEYGVFIWEKDYQGPAELLPHLWWRTPGRGGAA